MSIEQILHEARSMDDVRVLAPGPGSDVPEIAWGDYFVYHAPDGDVPQHTQPFATIVTKDYPGDTGSALDAEDRWRVNVHVGAARFAELTAGTADLDPASADVVLPHPVYAALGWVAVVTPAARTLPVVLGLLHEAHAAAVRRAARRAGSSMTVIPTPPTAEDDE